MAKRGHNEEEILRGKQSRGQRGRGMPQARHQPYCNRAIVNPAILHFLC